jgi:hypothetical protein
VTSPTRKPLSRGSAHSYVCSPCTHCVPAFKCWAILNHPMEDDKSDEQPMARVSAAAVTRAGEQLSWSAVNTGGTYGTSTPFRTSFAQAYGILVYYSECIRAMYVLTSNADVLIELTSCSSINLTLLTIRNLERSSVLDSGNMFPFSSCSLDVCLSLPLAIATPYFYAFLFVNLIHSISNLCCWI